MTLWYTKMRSAESNRATVNSQDDGKCASQVLAEIIFFICQESVDLLYNLGADASPHQHFITLCKNRRVFSKALIFFLIQTSFTARLQPLLFNGILIFCSGNLQFPLSGTACDPRAMISTVLVNTIVLWSVKAGHTVNMPMFNLKESHPLWRWEMKSHVVAFSAVRSKTLCKILYTILLPYC